MSAMMISLPDTCPRANFLHSLLLLLLLVVAELLLYVDVTSTLFPLHKTTPPRSFRRMCDICPQTSAPGNHRCEHL